MYYSQTGNTEKIAKAILEEVTDRHEARLYRINEIKADDLSGYELVFLGAPCHDADLARPLKKLLESLPESPRFKLAGFFTHATYSPDRNARGRELFSAWAGKCSGSFEKTCQEKSIGFLGYFNCMGAPSPPIEAFIHSEIITSEDEWSTYLPEVRSHPNAEDLQNARTFARTILSNLQ